MKIDRLVAMANDIGDYFAARPDPESVVEGVADHMKRFWDPRMRRQLIGHVEQTSGEDLSPAVADAVRRLAARERA
jgi:formate dehydrogenase subunit delta